MEKDKLPCILCGKDCDGFYQIRLVKYDFKAKRNKLKIIETYDYKELCSDCAEKLDDALWNLNLKLSHYLDLLI